MRPGPYEPYRPLTLKIEFGGFSLPIRWGAGCRYRQIAGRQPALALDSVHRDVMARIGDTLRLRLQCSKRKAAGGMRRLSRTLPTMY